jgi:transposase-like protein
MPVSFRDKFRQRAIDLGGTGDQPVAKVAADLCMAISCLRRWVKETDGGRDLFGATLRRHPVRLHPCSPICRRHRSKACKVSTLAALRDKAPRAVSTTWLGMTG